MSVEAYWYHSEKIYRPRTNRPHPTKDKPDMSAFVEAVRDARNPDEYQLELFEQGIPQ